MTQSIAGCRLVTKCKPEAVTNSPLHAVRPTKLSLQVTCYDYIMDYQDG